jgi:hypothetical protein
MGKAEMVGRDSRKPLSALTESPTVSKSLILSPVASPDKTDWSAELAEAVGTILGGIVTIFFGGWLLMTCAALFPLPFALSYLDWCLVCATIRFLGAK